MIVCRCEHITEAQIRTAIERGADSVNEVKQWTRAGMGECQGRVCGSLLCALVVANNPTAEPGQTHVSARWPVRPLTLGALQRELPPRPPVQMGLLEIDFDLLPSHEDERE